MPGDAKYTLEKVSTEITDEANAELDAGRREALERLRSVIQETGAEVTKVVETSKRQADAVKRQILGAAELEARNRVLRAVEEASNQVFRDALDDVSKSSGHTEAALEALIREGAAVLGNDAVVECTAKDKKVVAAIIKRLGTNEGFGLSAGEGSISAAGGVVLHSKDTAVRFDNTFEARLERLRPELRKAVADILTNESQ